MVTEAVRDEPGRDEPGRLGPGTRQQALESLRTEHFDVLVIGGGVTGGGIAVDAAIRGLKVALVEQRDFAAGTSSRSVKLVHGGLRYLEQLNFGLVREALRERALLLQTVAPHLCRPHEMLIPMRHFLWQRLYYGAGLVLYDTMGGAGAVPRHRHLTKAQAIKEAPGLNRDRLYGALAFHDVQVDDARLTMELARTAAADGATVAAGVQAVDFEVTEGAVTGVVLRDLTTGETFTTRTTEVISASGVWSDPLQERLPKQASFAVQAAKGIHIVVPRDRINAHLSMFMRAGDSILIARTWGDHWIIGTTDTPWPFDLDHPSATRKDVEYLLGHLNSQLNEKLTLDDIEGVFAGLRPLVKGKPGATSKLSREHQIEKVLPGFTTISGGKLTTYRVMAKDAVDVALGEQAAAARPSRTAQTPLLGARGLEQATATARKRGAELGLGVSEVDRLLHRYGSLSLDVLDLIEQDPDLAKPVPGGAGYLGAEFVHAVTHEGALELADVLCRRTHVSFETFDRGAEAAPAVAALVGKALGWTDEQVAAETEAYLARVEAELASQALPDDEQADAVRATVLDPRVAMGRSS